MRSRENSLVRAARTICRENLGLGSTESLALVADPPMRGLAAELSSACREAGFRCELLLTGPVERAGHVPGGFTREALARHDAALLVTSNSLSHTTVRREAVYEDGMRMASMPRVTREMLGRLFRPGMAALVEKNTAELASRLEPAGEVGIETGAGTRMKFSAAGRKVYRDTGIYTTPSRFGNLPAGEVSLAPVEGTARGRLVVDVAFAGLGEVSGLVLEIEEGRIVAADGDRAGELLSLLAGEGSRVAAEFGIGANPVARPCGLTLEAEKAVGTVHFGFGDNISFGGTNRAPGHWDAVLRCERITVDGRDLSPHEICAPAPEEIQ